MFKLTDEQEQIIRHPVGKHARVLAVAGSGKTSTMVERIKYLVEQKGVNPKTIQVLMFNRLAADQFRDRMNSRGIPDGKQPPVNTFHSYAYRIVHLLNQNGLLPSYDLWEDDKEEIKKRRIREAVRKIQQETGNSDLNEEEAEEAIALWKASMIPPERAGHSRNPKYAEVYALYEKLRIEQQGLTFDDMLIIAVQALDSDKELRDQLCGHLRFVIVDEYQDVNYVQQRLVQLVAGDHADLMVVGDDDQTIYEWRGARPEYIRKFPQIFNNRPCIDYKLTRSFRFGPHLAQCAHNTIQNNHQRIRKPVVAHEIGKTSKIRLITVSSHDPSASNSLIHHLIETIKLLRSDAPKQIVILGRTWAQLSMIEGELMRRRIPYRLLGGKHLLKRYEIQQIINYLWLITKFESPLTADARKKLSSVINFPNRRIPVKTVEAVLDALPDGVSVSKGLSKVVIAVANVPNASQKTVEAAQKLQEVMSGLHSMYTTGSLRVDKAIEAIVNQFGIWEHLRNYYGGGEESAVRINAVLAFHLLAHNYSESSMRQLGSEVSNIIPFLQYVAKLDPQQGYPDELCIPLTTVHRTKGLEWEYVFIPSCLEGFMPVTIRTDNPCYDTAGLVPNPKLSDWDESERRLFYVAITRASKMCFIETAAPPQVSSLAPVQKDKMLASRYIGEMMLNPTEHVVTALQRIHSEQGTSQELLDLVQHHASAKPVWDNMLQFYLPQLGLEGLVRDLQERLQSVTQAVPPISTSRSDHSSQKKQKGWWDEIE